MNSSFGLNGNVLVGSISRATIAWDVFSGEKKWAIEFDDTLSFNNSRGIEIIPNGFIAVSNRSYLYKIFTDGTMSIVDTDARSYEMFYDNGIVYTGQVKNMEGMVSAYDVNTFELLWRFNPGGLAYPAYTAPIVENNIVYIGTTAGPTGSRNGFFALNAQTGEEIWRQEGINTYSAVLAGDRIFGVNGQRVWALDKHTGELLWITRGQGGHSESNLDYLDGHVYWAHGGGLHVFDAESGELLHVLPALDGSFFWRVTAGAGRIFAQSSSHLYAFAPWGHNQPLEE
jgi:outer membrane protein assembly factor BamB